MLAKKKSGMKGIISRKRIALSTAKARLAKMRICISGIVVAQLVEDEGDEQGGAGGDAEPGDGAAPAPDARLLQAEHGEPHAGGDQHRAAVVERRRVLLVVRLGDRDQHERGDRDRDVDPEDRPPGPLGQVAAGDRPDRGEGAGEAEEDRQRAAALAQREGGEDDRQGGREHQRRAGALDHAEDDDPRLCRAAGRGGAAQRRGGGEDDDADHDHAPVPGDVGEPAAEGEQGREREQVAVDDPLHPGRGEREVPLQLGDRDRDDRLVDEGHRDGEDHRREDQLLVGAAVFSMPVAFAISRSAWPESSRRRRFDNLAAAHARRLLDRPRNRGLLRAGRLRRRRQIAHHPDAHRRSRSAATSA